MSDEFDEKARELANVMREQSERYEKKESPLIKDSILPGTPDVVFIDREKESERDTSPDQKEDREQSKEEDEERDEEIQDQEPEEEVSERPKKRHYSLKNQLTDMQRDKYRAMDEARQYAELYQKSQQELEETRKYLTTTEKGMMYTQQENIANRLAMAKQKKEDSRISGDVGAETSADIELNLALKELDRFNDLAIKTGYQYQDRPQQGQPQPQQPYYPRQEQHQPQYPQQQYPQQPQQPNFHPDTAYNIQNFSQRNTWIDRNSRDYDPKFVENFETVTDKYNRDLVNMGLGSQIGSAEYVQQVQVWVDKNRPNRNLSLNKSDRGYVAPAVGSGRGRSNSPSDVQLTQSEKDWARHFNMTEEQYKPWVAKFGRK
jgi:hypothetical protein